jgi:flavin-dependent dehydrogenase
VTRRAPERADAVVVGARPAGTATAVALASAGRHVVVLDRAGFPSDTLSTHLMFAGGVAELARTGVLEAVLALGAPPMPEALMSGAGIEVRAGYTPVEGIDYALCVRRTGLDAALVARAREAGADVREHTRATDLVWREGRVAGVRGEGFEIHAPLVVGADGRRSTVARLVGASEPYRSNANGRACFFAYLSDPHASWRGVAAQWRGGRELGTAFPCDGGLTLVLLMPPVEHAARFRADLDSEWERTIDLLPGLRERLDGCERVTKIRSAVDTTSYFRRSSGPGWALPGDAGHFKDPVTAQGIRDALRFGRLLGETAARELDAGPGALDRALRLWERDRELECLETYAWTNGLARAEPMTPIEIELYRAAAADPALATRVLDVFSRTRRPAEAVPLRLGARMTWRALRRPDAQPRAVLRAAGRELRDALRLRATSSDRMDHARRFIRQARAHRRPEVALSRAVRQAGRVARSRSPPPGR